MVFNKKNTQVTDLPCGGVSVVLHATEVFRIEGERLTLRHGGWDTPTTRQRINQCFDEWLPGYCVHIKGHDWFLDTPTHFYIPFTDGMVIKLNKRLP